MKDDAKDNELEVEIDESEEESLITYDIATYPSDFTLSGIFEMWRSKDITIPEFQREFVWTIRQSSLLIESFLLGLPVPPVFFYIDDENKNLVIDGQQRILSTIFFFEGYFGVESLQGKRQVFRLTGLDARSPYHRKQFKELSESDQRKLKGTVLRAINIKQLAPKEDNTSIYHIFERLNTGGTPLKAQEIRNVVFRGDFVTLLRELNKNSSWRRILGKKTYDKHQADVELVLRVFALSTYLAEYEKPMKEFLNMAMMRNRNANNTATKLFKTRFPVIAEQIVNDIGEKPFHKRGPMNTAILDATFCTLLIHFDRRPKNLSDRFAAFMLDEDLDELTTVGTTDKNTVIARLKLAKTFLID